MASASANKSFVARAAAILTTGEVAGTSFDLNNAWGSEVSIRNDFTLGSLTNVVLRFYVSNDGVTFYPLLAGTGAALTRTVAANDTAALQVRATGWKFLRVSAQGTGTVTSSSLAVTFQYLRRGSQ